LDKLETLALPDVAVMLQVMLLKLCTVALLAAVTLPVITPTPLTEASRPALTVPLIWPPA
jgi:hypothetical protein